MPRRTALLALVLLLACASFASANVAYRVFEDDPKHTQILVQDGMIGFFIGAMLLACVVWYVGSQGSRKVLAGTSIVGIFILVACGFVFGGGGTHYMKGNRPPGNSWAFRPVGAEPLQEQAIYPMTCGFVLALGISGVGLLLVRWRRKPTYSETPEGFGESQASPDGTMN